MLDAELRVRGVAGLSAVDASAIEKEITLDKLANIVGSTRQWVTMTLDKFQKRGLIVVGRQRIVIE